MAGEARRAFRVLRGLAPDYDNGDRTPIEGHPSVKRLLQELGATLSPTQANGNCMCSALLESDINRAAKSLRRTDRPLLEAAMIELKGAIFDAFDSDSEHEAKYMHHDDSITWMEETGATREDAHHRYFARLRDSSCAYDARVPQQA